MSDALPAPDWAVLTVLLPLLGAALAFVAERQADRIGFAATTGVALSSVMLLLQVAGGAPYQQSIGGWAVPLGIALKADGLAALMLAMTGLVGLGVAAQALRTMASELPPARQGTAAPWAFWPLWLLLLGGLNALYLSADQFNLYVTLEIVSLAAVGLTALSGKPEAFTAAMRYLLVGFLASLLYLLGVALLYARYGVLDIGTAQSLLRPEPVAQLAMTVMLAGLALKSALFPLHFWLPPAHGNAAASASALLSALVVKASVYLVLRLWFDLFGPTGLATEAAGLLLGLLGAGAILWGSLQAVLAERLKLLVAYSTVAQVGYLFLALPLDGTERGLAWQGVAMLALAHAFAKSAMFLCCQIVQDRLGHDRIRALTSSAKLPRSTQLTLALAAISLIGLPPSGGFVGKWLLLQASLEGGFTLWTAVIMAGTLLSATAMFRVLVRFFAAQPDDPVEAEAPPPGITARLIDLVPFALAAVAILLGLVATWPLMVLQVGAGG
ncbi:complex I subunit 5 family protein [Rubellimicrobium roseum]|uniref:Oxidoreductase n=1 Tax=Rubellimicrobium roseum TaxID=687525 RepID=A0A5C4N8P2_9RHOB|nr:proton-conducting transporter membrane subunit [Rubellimicrobium roseum]TNC65806.1 oxidoreductase [Rubellimicrobium roseum]